MSALNDQYIFLPVLACLGPVYKLYYVYGCKRWRTNRSELAAQNFFSRSYGKSKQRNISETIDFFRHSLWNIKYFFSFTLKLITVMNQPAPAHPYRSLTGYFSVCSEYTNLKFYRCMDTGFKIVV